jgi:hypothetical protein
MHYRDGTPVELGDKVTVADPESTPADIHGGATGNFAKIPPHYLTEQGKAERTGTVVGRDTKGTCGVAIFRPTGEVPRGMGFTVICTQSQEPGLFVVEGRMVTCETAYLQKLA